ncbi:hypothetical protein RRG08_025722 [Elysia crispata]|uniref:Uncharacterized protein n=1 Tax=Elysia crispata TaxID=231223 RepID=A0AAE1DY86_9GAST|nr:hypothetical protein RRG08_025722 [Elysia crispata]
MARQVMLIILMGLMISIKSQISMESSESVCQRVWIERLLWTIQSPTQPNTEEFRDDVLQGKPAKVVIEKGSYRETFILDNVNMNGNLICGEFTDRLTSPIGPDSEFHPVLVCSSGRVDFLNTSISKWDGNVVEQTWPVDAISFRTRDYSPDNSPVSSRYLDGTSDMQYTDRYMDMALKSELRGVMRDRAYAFNMDNIHIDQNSGHISCQSLSHVSQTYPSPGGITFRSQPYSWLSSWDTSGRRDSSRWTLGNVRAVGHTNDYVALQWYADPCWTVVFKHDKDGIRQSGSLDMLKAYVRMGHRVRVHFDGFTLEANSVVISPDGSVMAQTSSEMARRLGTGTDKTFFNTKTRQVYRLIHTSGEVRSFYFFIQNGLLSERSAGRFDMIWSVDTRPWNPVLTVNKLNQITFGTIRELVVNMDVASARIGVQLKEKDGVLKGQNSELFLEVNSMRTSSPGSLRPDVISQSLRTIPYYMTKGGKTYTMDLYQPQKQYIEISTVTGVAAHRVNMKSREYDVLAGWDVQAISWFQDNRLGG